MSYRVLWTVRSPFSGADSSFYYLPGSLLAKPCKWAFSHTYKTIASIFKLYQFDYAIWCERSEFLIVEKFLLLDFVKYLQKLPGIFVEER